MSMPTSREVALAQIDEFLAEFDDRESKGLGAEELIARGLAAIERAAPASVYSERARASLHQIDGKALRGVEQAARALRADLANGHVRPLEEIVRAAVFEDFLDMATELLDKGFNSPAAVVAGSVLEEHTRKLATRERIPVRDANNRPRSFDALATDLVKHGEVLETERKFLVALYGLRTAAAHGQHSAVVTEELTRMVPAIRDFMVRHPA
jgi:hypothetical protein